jgi:hypothetical protein
MRKIERQVSRNGKWLNSSDDKSLFTALDSAAVEYGLAVVEEQPLI